MFYLGAKGMCERGWLNALRMNSYNLVFRIVFWVFSIYKIHTIHLFLCVWKIFGPIVQIPTYLGSRGLPFFGLRVFFFQYAHAVSYEFMCQIHMIFDCYFFVVSHFIFVMAVISHCDSLSLRVLFSNFQCYLRKILSRWHHFSFLLFVFLHQSTSYNFSLFIELTSNRLIYYNTVVYRLYLAQFV